MNKAIKRIKLSDTEYKTDRCVICCNKETHVKNSTTTLKSGIILHRMVCRKCNNERARKYYKNNKIKFQHIIYKSIEKHKEKQRCREESHRLLKFGLLTMPKRCSVCKEVKKLTMHHEDYTRPDLVIWACTGCHADIHKKMSLAK
jgi:hypothetical protein